VLSNKLLFSITYPACGIVSSATEKWTKTRVSHKRKFIWRPFLACHRISAAEMNFWCIFIAFSQDAANTAVLLIVEVNKVHQ
jgi:hypothetical protein